MVKLRWLVSISLILFLCSSAFSAEAKEITIAPDTFEFDLTGGDTVERIFTVSWDGEIEIAANITASVEPDSDGINVSFSVAHFFVLQPGTMNITLSVETDKYLYPDTYTIYVEIEAVEYTEDCDDCPDCPGCPEWPGCSDCPDCPGCQQCDDCPDCEDVLEEQKQLYYNLWELYNETLNNSNLRYERLFDNLSKTKSDFNDLQGDFDELQTTSYAMMIAIVVLTACLVGSFILCYARKKK